MLEAGANMRNFSNILCHHACIAVNEPSDKKFQYTYTHRTHVNLDSVRSEGVLPEQDLNPHVTHKM